MRSHNLRGSRSGRYISSLAVALLLTGLAGRLSASEATLIALGTTNRVASPQGSPNWHYRLGSSEASSPVTAWRTNDFVEDGTWSVGSLPLGYATAINDPNNYEGTLVTTVPATTTCVYLRRTFVLTNRLVYSALTVSGFADDGVVVWINGRELAAEAQLLVTMGCGDECPYVPGVRRDDWPLDDPKGQPIERVRAIRDDICTRVGSLIVQEGAR